MPDQRPTVPVLVEVIQQADAVTFTSRLPSGRLTSQTIPRPAYLSPGADLLDPDALPSLRVWSWHPAAPEIPRTTEHPVMLAHFEIDPDTAEGAAALAALGMKRWTQPSPLTLN